jgi:hypothetical protein
MLLPEMVPSSVYLDRRMLVGKDLGNEDLSFQQETTVMLLYDSGDMKVFERLPILPVDSE